MVRKITANTEVTQEDEKEIVGANLLCPDPDCKRTLREQLRDHEVRIRNTEIAMADSKRLSENITKMIENSEETQRATISTLTDMSQAFIRMDGKVDYLVQRDQERGEDVDSIRSNFSKFKDEYRTKEESYKIDTRSIKKDIVLKVVLWAFGSFGAIQFLMQAADWLAKVGS